MEMKTAKSDLYNLAATLSLYGLLIFTPLARGSVQPWSQSLLSIFIVVAVTLLILEGRTQSGQFFRKTELFQPILVLFGWMIVSALFSPVPSVAIEAMTEGFSYLTLYYIVIHTVRSRKQQRQLVYLIISISLFLSIFGFFRLFDLNPFSWWDYGQSTALTSTYVNHNHLAGYLEMSIPLLLGLFVTKTRKGVLFYLLLYFLVIIMAAHILALSRGGWIALVLSLSLMSIILLAQKRFKQKKFLFSIVAFAVFLFLFVMMGTNMVERILSLTDKSTIGGLANRYNVWQGTYQMILDNVVTGVGPGSYATNFTQYQPPGLGVRFFYAHNDYLHYLAELGLPFLFIMALFLYVIFKKGFKKIQSPSRQTWGITLGALTGITAILIHSFFDFNLHIPGNAILFTTLVALVMLPPSQKTKII